MSKQQKPVPLLKPFELTAPPKAYAVLDRTLAAFMRRTVPIESGEGLRRRERVMEDLKREFVAWVTQVARKKGMSEKMAEGCGGQMHTSGSYRLRVHEPGADIDTVCVTPDHCTREDFFDSMKKRLLDNPRVTNLRSVETAMVPIMTFDFDEINIDMLFARLPLNTVSEAVDIDNDETLRGVDESTEKSLNGPRVTNLLHQLVVHNYEPFLTVLRFARVWAKRRGIYSNKLGYLGGINFNILVALVCQVFPKATPSYLLTKFFHIFAAWEWPSPALLCAPADPKIGGFEVWGAAEEYGRYHHSRNNLMPIITPAYPAMNSAANVNPMTFGVIREEFERASRICKSIVSSHNGAVDSQLEGLSESWAELLEPSDFFERYDAYLAINVLGHGDLAKFEDFRGFFSSRLRKFVERLAHLPLKKIHLFPKEFPNATSPDLAPHSCCYFVGVVIDTLRLGTTNKALVLTHIWSQFWSEDIKRFNGLDETLDLKLEHFKWAQLPEFVFAPGRKAQLLSERRKERRLLAKQAAAEAAAIAAAAAAAAEEEEVVGEEDTITTTTIKRERDPEEEEEQPSKRLKGEEEGEEALVVVAEDALALPEEEEEEEVVVEEQVEEVKPLSLATLPTDLPELKPTLPKWHPQPRTKQKKITLVLLDETPPIETTPLLLATAADIDPPQTEAPALLTAS